MNKNFKHYLKKKICFCVLYWIFDPDFETGSDLNIYRYTRIRIRNSGGAIFSLERMKILIKWTLNPWIGGRGRSTFNANFKHIVEPYDLVFKKILHKKNNNLKFFLKKRTVS